MSNLSSNSLGFILLTHTKPVQIYRLIDKLNRMFNYPLIVCHHDFSKCNLSVDNLSKNVLFVCPHLQTGWASFALVEATVQALRLMYDVPEPPDWFILLSGADYPIKTARYILDDLTLNQYDAYIQHEQITYETYKNDARSNMLWLKNSYQRYCTKSFSFHHSRKYSVHLNLEIYLEHPLLTKLFLPFSRKIACFSGSQWFCANGKAAKYIIDFHSRKNALTLHYSKLRYADESYFQTILANATHLKLKNDRRRYIDWSDRGTHPKTLLMEDLPNLLASSAHFARKFDIDVDSQILDELDRVTL